MDFTYFCNDNIDLIYVFIPCRFFWISIEPDNACFVAGFVSHFVEKLQEFICCKALSLIKGYICIYCIIAGGDVVDWTERSASFRFLIYLCCDIVLFSDGIAFCSYEGMA